MSLEIFTHTFNSPPVFQLLVYRRPSIKGKSKASYIDAVRVEAKRRISVASDANDIELSIIYTSRRPVQLRSDVDNILKPTLDALCGYAYRDDRQVRAVSARVFDRTKPLTVLSNSSLGIALLNPLLYSVEDDAVIIHIYSETQLRVFGHDFVLKRIEAEALEETERVYNSNNA